jgi:glycine oxidase
MAHPDVLIIGGGVIGCATAYELAKAGLKVTVVERGQPGCEASGAAAGMLAPQGEISAAGPFLELGLASKALYPTLAEELKDRTGIDIEYQSRGTLHLFFDAGDEAVGRAVYAWQHEHELSVQLLTREELLKLEPHVAPEIGGALFLPGDHWVNNQRLVTALVQAGAELGVEFKMGAEVKGILSQSGRVTGVSLDDSSVHAGALFLAAGAWSGTLLASIGCHLPVFPVRGQMLALRQVPRLIAHVLHRRDHYLVPRVDGEIVVGSTMERVGKSKHVTAEAIQALLHSAMASVPALGGAPLLRVWAGFRPWAPDGLPLLGAWSGIEELYVATGHFRNGILLAPITAKLLRELIVEGATSISLAPFRPDRFSGKGYSGRGDAE